LLDGLSAVHHASRGIRQSIERDGPGRWDGEVVTGSEEFVHPVVRVDPETGRRGLFVNPAFTTQIVGLTQHESAELLALIYDLVVQPENVVRYRWTPGSVGFWDNRTIWHRRVTDFVSTERRVAHRVLLEGDQPVGPSGAAAA
jgi:taurine dioxygenase